MNYVKLANYAGRYLGKSAGGNPAALTIAAVLGICAVGAYIVESLTEKATD